MILMFLRNNSRQLTCSSVKEARRPPFRLVFEKRKRPAVSTVSSKWGGTRRDAGGSHAFLRRRAVISGIHGCSLLLLHRSRKGCGGRDARDTKRAETLSRNRNQAAWSLRSALPEEEEGGWESRGRDGCVAHALRLHRGIRWLGSSRDPRGGSLLLPPIPPFLPSSGILQNSSTLPRSPRSNPRHSILPENFGVCL